jgi:hypothetical protein
MPKSAMWFAFVSSPAIVIGPHNPGDPPCASAELRFRPHSPPGSPLCRSDRQAQYYPLAPFPLFWPFCVAAPSSAPPRRSITHRSALTAPYYYGYYGRYYAPPPYSAPPYYYYGPR